MILNESNPLLYILNAFQILHNNTCFDCIQWSEFKLGAFRKRRQLFFDKRDDFHLDTISRHFCKFIKNLDFCETSTLSVWKSFLNLKYLALCDLCSIEIVFTRHLCNLNCFHKIRDKWNQKLVLPLMSWDIRPTTWCTFCGGFYELPFKHKRHFLELAQHCSK